MKRKIKLFTALFTVAAISVAMLTGCGKEKSNVSVVRVWTGEGATKQFMDKKVAEFNDTVGKEKNIKIDYKVVMSGLDDMIKSSYENGDGPEIVSGSLNGLKQLRQLGYVVPITDVAGGQEFLNSLDVEIPETSTYMSDGKVYAFPTTCLVGGIVYNKDLFKKVGFVDSEGKAKAPETWDEVIEVSKKIRKQDKTKYGIALPMKDGFVWGYAMGWAMSASSNGIEYDWENKTVSCDSSRNLLEVMLKLKEADVCFPGSENLDNDTARLQFSEGNIGMFMGCSWDVGVLTEQFPAKCDWGVAEYPVIDKNDKYLQNGQIGSSMRIGKSAKTSADMEKAVMEVYKWLYGDEIQQYEYQIGQSLPYCPRLIEKFSNIDVPEQQKEFNKLRNVTRTPAEVPSLKIEGDTSTVVYEKVWIGEMTVDEAIKDLNTRYSKAFKKGIEDGSLIKSDYNTDVSYKR